jgi:hypothetical protein
MLSVINESVARGPLFVKKFMDIEIEECIERVRKEREASRNSGGGGHHRGPIEATKETEKRKEWNPMAKLPYLRDSTPPPKIGKGDLIAAKIQSFEIVKSNYKNSDGSDKLQVKFLLEYQGYTFPAWAIIDYHSEFQRSRS